MWNVFLVLKVIQFLDNVKPLNFITDKIREYISFDNKAILIYSTKEKYNAKLYVTL